MARLNIESFQKGIEKKREQIKKLESQIEHLQKKIDKTIYCKKCNNHWDAMYLIAIEPVQNGCLVKMRCPMCDEFHHLIVPYFDKYVGIYADKKYMYNIFKNDIKEL